MKKNNSQTFNECEKAFYSMEEGSEAKARALNKMLELAQTFNEWRKIYYSIEKGSEVKTQALNKMAELAQTFEARGFKKP